MASLHLVRRSGSDLSSCTEQSLLPGSPLTPLTPMTPMSPVIAGDGFRSLLQKLEEEHVRELTRVRADIKMENEGLRQRLRNATAAEAQVSVDTNFSPDRQSSGALQHVSSDIPGVPSSLPPIVGTAADLRAAAQDQEEPRGAPAGAHTNGTEASWGLPPLAQASHLPGAMEPTASQLQAPPRETSRVWDESNARTGMLALPPGKLTEDCAPAMDKLAVATTTAGQGPTFPLRDMWNKKEERRKQSINHRRPTVNSRRLRQSIGDPGHDPMRGLHEMVEVESMPSPPKPVLQRMVSKPGSKHRLAWDLFGGVLILYDLVIIPLSVFSPPETLFLIFMDWMTLIFWTLNIPASFLVGFVQSGETVMDIKKIAKHYVRFWFWVDLVVVVPDWTFTCMAWINDATGTGGGGRAVKLLRILRLARTIRLLRLLKLGWILTIINDLLDSEAASIIANIIKMILVLLGTNHFIACMWYAIGSECMSRNEANWLEIDGFDDRPWNYQYLTSFHWSITQFTPASMNVNAHHFWERVFAIFVVVFALVGFSYLVGSITGSLTQLRGMKEEAAKEFWKLRRYLKRNNVNFELSMRIQRYLEHEYHRQTEGSTPNKVKLLQLLSEQLHNELQYAMAVPHIQVHPLFTFLGQVSEVVLQRLSQGAIYPKHFARGDPVFLPTETATACYFLVSGKLQYTRDTEGKEHKEDVDKGEDWVAEPVLWTPRWVHLGVLVAVHAQNHMMLVDSDKFAAIISKTPSAYRIVQHYAVNFMKHLNSVPDEELSDVSQGENLGETIRAFIFKDNAELYAEHGHWFDSTQTHDNHSVHDAAADCSSWFSSAAASAVTGARRWARTRVWRWRS